MDSEIMTHNIVIDDEFKALIPPLASEERAQLERNLVAEGCRDPLVVWTPPAPQPGEHKCYAYDESKCDLYAGDGVWTCGHCKHNPALLEHVLVDGHNRYEICTRLQIPFDVVEVELEDREAVKDWIDANQLGRRNLTPDQFTLLLGRRYNRTKKAQFSRPGNDNAATERGDQIDPRVSTADKLAAQYGVSAPTVKRAGQYADAIEKVERAVPGFSKPPTAPRQAIVKAAKLLESAPEKAAAIIHGEKTLKDIKREERQAEIDAQREALNEQPPVAPDGEFDVIVLDPPWNYGTPYDPDGRRGACPYPEMTQAQLLAMEIPAKSDAVMFLWTTHKFLFDAKALMDAWGFEYKAAMVWDKEMMGMGAWLRMQCEFCLVGVKGKPFWQNTSVRDIVRAKRREHSRKPDEFYQIVEQVTAGRKLEYFARTPRDGWVVFGNDTERFPA